MVMQHVSEMGVGICVIAEPVVIPDSPRWHGSRDGKAAIYWIPDRLESSCILVRRGRNHVVSRCGNLTVVMLPVTKRNKGRVPGVTG